MPYVNRRDSIGNRIRIREVEDVGIAAWNKGNNTRCGNSGEPGYFDWFSL